MKLNTTFRHLMAVTALVTAAPAVRAERVTNAAVTDAQQACIQQILANAGTHAEAIRNCVPTAQADKRPELAPDSQTAKALFEQLEARFDKNPSHSPRPKGISFSDLKDALAKNPALLWSIAEMEKTGGAPDLIDVQLDAFIIADVSKEAPEGRRDLTYDQAAKMVNQMGIQMMDRVTYRNLQELVSLDRNTSVWLLTDEDTRKQGYALIGYRDRLANYDVVTQGNYAERPHPFRGWRGVLRVPRGR